MGVSRFHRAPAFVHAAVIRRRRDILGDRLRTGSAWRRSYGDSEGVMGLRRLGSGAHGGRSPGT